MKALTVGGATIDVIATIGQKEAERLIMQNAETSFMMIEEGKKGDAQRIEDHVGGGALNTAVALARLGLETATVVKLGQDNAAETILERLAAEKVETTHVVRSVDELTGRAIFLSGQARNPTIFVARGANTTLVPDDFAGVFETGFELVHITPLSGEAAQCLAPLVMGAKAAGAFVSVNPGRKQIEKFWPVFQDILPKVDLLSLNKVEAQVMARWIKGSVDIPDDMRALTHLICTAGARFVSLTDGAEGAYLSDGTAVHHAPARKVEVHGTAGAGDAFCATLAWALSSGYTMEKAARAALYNAGSVVGHSDTLTGLLTAPEVTVCFEAD